MPQTETPPPETHEDYQEEIARLGSLGELARGAAHDFYHHLGLIKNHLNFIVEDFAKVPPIQRDEDIETIREAIEQGEDLARRLSLFGQQRTGEPVPANLHEVVQRIAPLLHFPTICLRLDIDPELPKVYLDPVQVEQVIMNLAFNARDAMPHGGNLTITATEQGQTIALMIRDEGSGIDPETLPNIFLPFFSTKGRGKNTGLGLSSVYQMVKAAGGEITVRSKLGAGTTFIVLLPIAPPD